MIALGNDHAGYELKNKIADYFKASGIGFKDFGCYSSEAADYPIYARAVCEGVLSGEYKAGILLCNTGTGMTVAANRFKGIRAAICRDERTATAARDHNDANVLVLGAKTTDHGLCMEIIKVFLACPFSNEAKHIKRIQMLDS